MHSMAELDQFLIKLVRVDSQLEIYVLQFFTAERWRQNLVIVGTIFTKIVQFEESLDTELLKFKNSYLVELLQNQSKTIGRSRPFKF